MATHLATDWSILFQLIRMLEFIKFDLLSPAMLF